MNENSSADLLEKSDPFFINHYFNGNESLCINFGFKLTLSNGKEMYAINKFVVSNPFSVSINDWKILANESPKCIRFPLNNAYGRCNINISKSLEEEEDKYDYVFVSTTSGENNKSLTSFTIPHEIFQPYFSKIIKEMESVLEFEKSERERKLEEIVYFPDHRH